MAEKLMPYRRFYPGKSEYARHYHLNPFFLYIFRITPYLIINYRIPFVVGIESDVRGSIEIAFLIHLARPL